MQIVRNERSGKRLWRVKMLCLQQVVLVVLGSVIPVEVSAGIGSYLARLEAKHTENTTVYNRYSGSECNRAEPFMNSCTGALWKLCELSQKSVHVRSAGQEASRHVPENCKAWKDEGLCRCFASQVAGMHPTSTFATVPDGG